MRFLCFVLLAIVVTGPALAQVGGPKGPIVKSPVVAADRKVTFSILAPKAEKVSLFTSDIPGGMEPRTLKKGENGVWDLTIGPVDAGTYRYLFMVDGVMTVDIRNQSLSESNGSPWSVVHVPGADWMDTKDVPHGAVSRITYKSGVTGTNRRMHIYTPPGYAAGSEKYPVLYLLHGAGDSDDSWTSVGRAHMTLDNLIAAKKAKPMIVVMPCGHTGPFSFIMPTDRGAGIGNAKFEDEFAKDIMPYVEANYRVHADRANRAVAGLSMGGGQTLNLMVQKPQEFAYVGVFSSGIFANTKDWEKQHADALTQLKGGLKLLWIATGKDDFLIQRSKETVAVLKPLNPEWKETDGGHTWIKWQQYFHEFAPRLFQ